MIDEDPRVGAEVQAAFGAEGAQEARGLGPEGTGAELPAFADEPDLGRCGQLQIGRPDVEEFLHPGSRIEQGGQHGVVAAPRGRGAVDGRQDGLDFLVLERLDGPRPGPFEGDAQDPRGVLQAVGMLRAQKAEEGVEGRQPDVTRAPGAVAGRFEVREKGDDR